MKQMLRLLFAGLLVVSSTPVWAQGVLAPGGGALGGLPAVGSEGDCLLVVDGVPAWGACPGAGSGAPTDAKYIVQTANGTLSAEQALSTLATGIMMVTTSTGVISVAIAGTDYVIPAGNVATATALAANGSNCSAGQAPLGVSASGAAETCTDYQEEPSGNGIVAKTAANTSANRTITGTANQITVTNGDGVSGNPTLSFPTNMTLPGTTTGTFSGNASTATALAANGSNCSAGQFPLGVDASGAVESCTALPTTIAGTSSEITASASTGAVTLSLPSSIDLGSKSLEIPNSASLPGTCTVGQIYMDTDATSGQRIYACQATNTWALQGDGGGGGSSSTGSDDAVQTADGAGAFQDSGCTAVSGVMTCSGGFIAGTSGVGIVTMLEGTAPGAGTNAGEHNLYFDSTGSLLKSHENGGSVVTYYSTANAPTSVSGNAGTATALAANPSDCAANNFATTIAANGDLTCAQPSISAGVSGLGSNVATFLGTPSSANLISAVTNETGTGALVFGTAPTIDAPVVSTKINLPRVTAFPGTPSAGDTVIVTDDSTAGACDSGAGSATSLCQYSGSAWVKLGDGTSGGGALSSTDIDTSSELRAILGDESGTGALIFADGAIGAATATTPSANDNDTSVATTAYVQTELTAYASDSATFTNKTMDVEGAGNVFTTVRRVYFPAAGCNNTTAGSVWDLPTSNPAVAACKTGTNTQMGTLDFADSSNLSAQITYMLPTTWTGTIDARIKWLTSATSGDVVWQLSTICVADAETDDPAFNTASTVTDTAKGTTLQTNDAAITTVTVTGCAAGELMHLKIQRDAAHASDNLAATARLIGVELAVREAL